jgi:hypothetical protein
MLSSKDYTAVDKLRKATIASDASTCPTKGESTYNATVRLLRRYLNIAYSIGTMYGVCYVFP